MRFITGIGQRWKQALGASLTIALLTAVAVVGISLFGSEVLAAWKTSDNAEEALVSASVLNFDAPAATVARFNSETAASNSPQVVSNWKYTQNPLLDLLATNPLVDAFLFQAAKTNPVLNDFLQLNPTTSALVTSGTLSFYGTYLGQTLLPAVNSFIKTQETVLSTIAKTNPALAPLVNTTLNTLNAFQTTFNQTVVNTVTALQKIQQTVNNSLPPNVPKPAPIPNASGTT